MVIAKTITLVNFNSLESEKRMLELYSAIPTVLAPMSITIFLISSVMAALSLISVNVGLIGASRCLKSELCLMKTIRRADGGILF